MASFFRRNKAAPASTSAPRFSIEELAAAFPSAERRELLAPVSEAELVAAVEASAEARAPAVEPTAAEIAPAEIAPSEIAPAQVTPAQVTPAQVTPAEMAPAEVAAADIAAAVPASAAIASNEVAQPVVPPSVSPPAFASPAAAAAIEPRPLPTAPAASPGKAGWRERLRGSVLSRNMASLFSRNPKLDEDLLDEIETALITADVGIAATTQLVTTLRQRMGRREFADAQALLAALRLQLVEMLRPVEVPLRIDATAKPFVILTVGVNGVGKTTTIGKLARRLKSQGHGLMLAAGDTFRAAAVAQLQAWGQRNDVPVIAQGQNAQGKGGDAASVAFDALQAARARGIDVLVCDTAGRLHTQVGLMDELGKIRRVLAKVDATAPHEVLMVIDGTTGQNALSQLRQFHAAAGVTGLVVTKLDGTAKGGVVFALAREFGIPIRFVGIGEGVEDLREFDATAFVDAMLPEAIGA